MLKTIITQVTQKINKITKRDQIAAVEAQLEAVLAQNDELTAQLKTRIESLAFACEDSRVTK